MRKNIVAGNWKMNKTLQEGIALAKELNEALANEKPNCDVVICTPFIHLASVTPLVDAAKIGVGAENCADKESEREANKQNEVVAAQLASVFSLSAEDFSKIILAYEPVWAIGTGKTATPAQAQEIHAFIRSAVEAKYGKEIAENCSILYGGSCKPSNAKELFANPDVDGGLIGGAALKVADFKGIIDAFN